MDFPLGRFPEINLKQEIYRSNKKKKKTRFFLPQLKFQLQEFHSRTPSSGRVENFRGILITTTATKGRDGEEDLITMAPISSEDLFSCLCLISPKTVDRCWFELLEVTSGGSPCHTGTDDSAISGP